MKKIFYALTFLLAISNVRAAGLLDYVKRGVESMFYVTVRIPHAANYSSSESIPIFLVLLVIASIMGVVWMILEWQKKLEFLSQASKNVKITISLTVTLIAVYSSPIVETIINVFGALFVAGSVFAVIGLFILIVLMLLWVMNRSTDVLNYGAKTYKDFKDGDVSKWVIKNWNEEKNKEKKETTLKKKIKYYEENAGKLEVTKPVSGLGTVIMIDKVISGVTGVLNELLSLEKIYSNENPIGLSQSESSDASKLLNRLSNVITDIKSKIQDSTVKTAEDALLNKKMEEIPKKDKSKLEIEIEGIRKYSNRIKQTLESVLSLADRGIAQSKTNPGRMKEIIDPIIKQIDHAWASLSADYKSLETLGAQFDNAYETLKKQEGEGGNGKEEELQDLLKEIVFSLGSKQIKLSYNGLEVKEPLRVNLSVSNDLLVEIPELDLMRSQEVGRIGIRYRSFRNILMKSILKSKTAKRKLERIKESLERSNSDLDENELSNLLRLFK